MIDFDIRQILDHYNIPYKEKKNSNELYFLCPFHNDTEFGSALFNEITGSFNCFSCKAGGNSYRFVMDMEKCDFNTAKQLLESDFDDKVYDLNNLNEKLQRAEVRFYQTPKFNKDIVAVVFKFLDTFSTMSVSPEFFNKWYIASVYLSYLSDSSMNDLDKIYLRFCTQFYTEIKQEKL